MIAFDSNVLIYALSENPEFQEQAFEVFREINIIGGLCSTLVITESLYGSFTSREQLTPLLSNMVTTVPVSTDIAELAGKLRIMYGIKNMDAIHIATALHGNAEIFITNDQLLLKKKIKGIKIRGL